MYPSISIHFSREEKERERKRPCYLESFKCISFGDAFVLLGLNFEPIWITVRIAIGRAFIPFYSSSSSHCYMANVQFERFILAHLRSQLVVLIAPMDFLCNVHVSQCKLFQWKCSRCSCCLYLSLSLFLVAAKFWILTIGIDGCRWFAQMTPRRRFHV